MRMQAPAASNAAAPAAAAQLPAARLPADAGAGHSTAQFSTGEAAAQPAHGYTVDLVADRPAPAARAPHPGRRLWLAAAALCAALFALVSHQVHGGARWALAFDGAVAAWVRALRTPGGTIVAMDLTALGSTAVVTLVATICCVVFALLRDARAIVHLAVASAGAGLWSRALKLFFERPRPDDLPPLVQVWNHSYPSGHTVTATALYLTFAVLACRVLRRPHERAVVFAAAALVVLLVGLTRVYLGAHHPSDVVGGAAVGAAWAFLLAGLIGYPPARDGPLR